MRKRKIKPVGRQLRIQKRSEWPVNDREQSSEQSAGKRPFRTSREAVIREKYPFQPKPASCDRYRYVSSCLANAGDVL